MADINSIQSLTQENGQPIQVERRDVLIDWIWNLVKTVCVPIAGLSLLYFSYEYGQRNPECLPNCQQTIVSKDGSKANAKTSLDQTKTELNVNTGVVERFNLAVEKLEKKTEQIQSSPQPTSTPTTPTSNKVNPLSQGPQATSNIKSPLEVRLVGSPPLSQTSTESSKISETSREKCEREAMQGEPRNCTNY